MGGTISLGEGTLTHLRNFGKCHMEIMEILFFVVEMLSQFNVDMQTLLDEICIG